MAVSARDAMDRQGRLSIAVKAVDRVPAIRNHPALGGDYVAASTMGTGSGIPADKIDQIIEAFFATKGGGQRTGLGLSQVFGFAKQPSGEIQVERRKDVGTAFTLFLPSFAATARVIRAEHVTASLGKSARILVLVLVLEDNADVGSFATSALAELGHFTALAGNGDEAPAQARGVGLVLRCRPPGTSPCRAYEAPQAIASFISGHREGATLRP